MSRRDKRDPWGESGKNWKDFGLVCLHCGRTFYGGIDQAMKPLLAHSALQHEGQLPRYAASATPVSYEAKKRGIPRPTISEGVAASKILHEHGSGWYFYALHYGAPEALARIADVGGMKPKTLRERVAAVAA